jgi:molybdate transport repressor ModE-like protein
MINFERLRALHAIAAQGSVSAAATALHVTNSAVSQQIAKFETEIGEPLLEPNGRGIRLTDTAARLVAHTETILSLMESAEAELDAKRGTVFGQVTVAAFPTAARGLVPQAFRFLRDTCPQLTLVLNEQEPRDALALLIRGDCDLVITQDWENAPLPQLKGLSRTQLLDDIADIALPARHRLARCSIIELDELRSDHWVTWGPGPTLTDMHVPAGWCRDWLVQTLRSRGHDPVIAHTAGEHATQLTLVAAGLGICVIPRLGRGPLPPGLRIVAVRPTLRRSVYALWRTSTTRRTAVTATVDAFRAAASMVEKREPSMAPKRNTSSARRNTIARRRC